MSITQPRRVLRPRPARRRSRRRRRASRPATSASCGRAEVGAPPDVPVPGSSVAAGSVPSSITTRLSCPAATSSAQPPAGRDQHRPADRVEHDPVPGREQRERARRPARRRSRDRPERDPLDDPDRRVVERRVAPDQEADLSPGHAPRSRSSYAAARASCQSRTARVVVGRVGPVARRVGDRRPAGRRDVPRRRSPGARRAAGRPHVGSPCRRR